MEAKVSGGLFGAQLADTALRGQFRRVRTQAFYNYTNKGFAGLGGASGAWVSGRGRAAGCISTHVVVAAVPAWRVLGRVFFRERFRKVRF